MPRTSWATLPHKKPSPHSLTNEDHEPCLCDCIGQALHLNLMARPPCRIAVTSIRLICVDVLCANFGEPANKSSIVVVSSAPSPALSLHPKAPPAAILLLGRTAAAKITDGDES
jgi:hypothetical protein